MKRLFAALSQADRNRLALRAKRVLTRTYGRYVPCDITAKRHLGSYGYVNHIYATGVPGLEDGVALTFFESRNKMSMFLRGKILIGLHCRACGDDFSFGDSRWASRQGQRFRKEVAEMQHYHRQTIDEHTSEICAERRRELEWKEIAHRDCEVCH